MAWVFVEQFRMHAQHIKNLMQGSLVVEQPFAREEPDHSKREIHISMGNRSLRIKNRMDEVPKPFIFDDLTEHVRLKPLGLTAGVGTDGSGFVEPAHHSGFLEM